MSNTPTDAEIEKLAQQHLKAFVQFSLGEVWFEGEVEFARAVLAKWGSPQPVVREPTDDEIDAVVQACRERGLRELDVFRAVLTKWGLQPVACEPLTCEWTYNDDDGYWDTSCGKAWRFDDGGPKENNMNFCHCCGKTLRIKGG